MEMKSATIVFTFCILLLVLQLVICEFSRETITVI